MKYLLSFVLWISGLAAIAQPRPSTQTIARPKLVVGIVVDQMRWDYLYRYWDRYGEGGFRKLVREGFSQEQTMINYLPTFTAPGHACIWTGSVPAIHGIAGNDWIYSASGTSTYCVYDSTVQPVGGSWRAGQMSPRNLLTTTVGDELKLATNGRSRVCAVSLKDRASILPGGHQSDGTYWYDDSTGTFMTSTYYRTDLPGWLQQFNARKLPDSMLRAGWTLAQPEKNYRHSTADSTPYEGRYKGEKTPTFPHTSFRPGDYGAIRALPAGNTLTLELAKTLLTAEKMGTGADPDLLAINLASTDYVGHQFAPNALEVEDLYLRLDRELAQFLAFLDQRYGKGNVLLFLTADHGGAHNPRFLQDYKIPAGQFTEGDMGKNMQHDADSVFGVNAPGIQKDAQRSVVRFFNNYYIYLDDTLIQSRGYNREAIIRRIRQYMLGRPGIADVVRLDDPSVLLLPEPIRSRIINGHHKKRSGDLIVIPEPGWFAGYAPTGTTHGTWNPYDAHIPLLFYGWNIPKGRSTQPGSMTDIAATLCTLLQIQMPNGCIGTPIRFRESSGN
ncbi:MAG: alkaline phosphatase family protein [Sphingobacteriales bacterium]|nr:MAG: alkaline phosphatase family protein [Sphingobacteriales bacterium]